MGIELASPSLHITISNVFSQGMLSQELLTDLYRHKKKSMQEIAVKLGCSVHKVQYWITIHKIPTRTISDAVYLKHNPKGDPFVFSPPKNKEDAILFGMGIGLYWGEGTKANLTSVRLGNTDPSLLKTFIRFLTHFFRIQKGGLRFGLQIFTDIPVQQAVKYWHKHLKIQHKQLYKVTVTRSGSIGTYRKKSRYGVLTVYYHNKKLRDLLVSLLPP